MKIAKELLINAFLVSNNTSSANYYLDEHSYTPLSKSILTNKPIVHFEFILNNKLQLVQCAKLHPASAKKHCVINEIPNYKDIYNELFEISHVRVNPNYDNTEIIAIFTKTLEDLGVKLHNKPKNNSIAVCFRPLGEITDTVRFYIKESNTAIFLASHYKPKLVYSKKL